MAGLIFKVWNREYGHRYHARDPPLCPKIKHQVTDVSRALVCDTVAQQREHLNTC